MAEKHGKRDLIGKFRKMVGWKRPPIVPVLRLEGTIGESLPARGGLTLAGVADVLGRAFETPGAVEVAIVVNSPGGSPAQSHLIYRRIRQLAVEHELPVTVYVEDVAASGGYMIACAADRILIDPTSILGSIGVISAGFGFERLIEKIGVERRVHTAGERKSLLDPFLPEDPRDVERLKAAQRQIHQTFIALVRTARGERLKGADADLFSGDFWVGEDAIALGLADGIAEIRSDLRARHGEKVHTPLIEEKKGFNLLRLVGMRAPQALAQGAVDVLRARSHWQRFGL